MKIVSKVLLFLLASKFSPALACEPIDYLKLRLPTGPFQAEVSAILGAYPDLRFDSESRDFVTTRGENLPLGKMSDVSPRARLGNASIVEQFLYAYPLSFDLEQRKIAFNDPGRLRNDAFFRALYFSTKKEAKKQLVRVDSTNGVTVPFFVTEKRNVACQLTAVFAELNRSEMDFSKYFRKSGGSFNWRVISGTKRLSAHSFGIAIDLNTELGQYWKWTGASVGKVGDYHNKFPKELISAFERYGFIWGGKWHHFDGMHFEFRPELILYSRLQK